MYVGTSFPVFLFGFQLQFDTIFTTCTDMQLKLLPWYLNSSNDLTLKYWKASRTTSLLTCAESKLSMLTSDGGGPGATDPFFGSGISSVDSGAGLFLPLEVTG
jgi:hypothetical protein